MSAFAVAIGGKTDMYRCPLPRAVVDVNKRDGRAEYQDSFRTFYILPRGPALACIPQFPKRCFRTRYIGKSYSRCP